MRYRPIPSQKPPLKSPIGLPDQLLWAVQSYEQGGLGEMDHKIVADGFASLEQAEAWIKKYT